MKLITYFFFLGILPTVVQAQGALVIDKKAIAKSGENVAINLAKGQQYKKIRDFTEDIHMHYFAIEALQQQVLNDWKQAESVRDLHWADLSRSLYLATELVKGPIQPGLEVDFVIEHPLFQRSPDDIYRDLFMAGSVDALPADLTSFQQARQTARSLTGSFHQLAAERKAYGAVAFQYLAEDLMMKATEMNEVLKQPERFAMTEVERIRLQSFSEEYLQLAGELLERSDQLLLDVAYVQPLRKQADQTHHRLERAAVATTPLFNY
ncbi:hypothetical protein [Tunicatimonas pelagia]|uniref:hypothetical protein n=1 Tax=Tunicatimonas pelagia TaxID=931531 RepID=UPI0026662244|nr:hypothetical protein [Tunicatimonas pelagia]WKN44927.1 hypothetical protein P0M28_08120 [Tunicatimonas pelagia]